MNVRRKEEMYMKLKNKVKFVRTILLVVGLILFINFLIPEKSYSYKELEYKKIAVLSGDTLWTIAKEEQENNAYYHGKDVREIIQDIKKVNGLSNAGLRINQILEIPTY